VKIAAGVYEAPDESYRLLRVEHEDVGPRGGSAWLWEYAEPFGTNDWCITGWPYSTLREAAAHAENL
jgi:hypothetical protein